MSAGNDMEAQLQVLVDDAGQENLDTKTKRLTRTYMYSDPDIRTQCICVNLVERGLIATTRNSPWILMQSLKIEGFNRIVSGFKTSAWLDLMVVYDRRPTGKLPTFAELRAATGGDDTPMCERCDVLSPCSTCRNSRFELLAHEDWQACNANSGEGEDFFCKCEDEGRTVREAEDLCSWPVSLNIPLRPRAAVFYDNRGYSQKHVSNIKKGALYVFLNTTVDAAFVADVSFELQFIDAQGIMDMCESKLELVLAV